MGKISKAELSSGLRAEIEGKGSGAELSALQTEVSEHKENYAKLKKDVGEVDYNVYQLILQNYYDGKNPYKRGIFFDGFINENVIDILNSNVYLDADKKIISFGHSDIDSLVGSNGKPIGRTSSEKSVGQTFLIERNVLITSIKNSLRIQGSPTSYLKCSIYNTDNGLPTTLIATSETRVYASELSSSNTEKTFLFNTLLTPGNYCFVLEKADGTVDSSNYYQAIGTYQVDEYSNGTLLSFAYEEWSAVINEDLNFYISAISSEGEAVYQSIEQTLSQLVDNATLYVKSKTVAGCLISAEITIYTETEIFETMTLESTRDLGDGYQEDKFTFVTATAGNNVKVKITLNRSDTTTEYEANEYGCILGVS